MKARSKKDVLPKKTMEDILRNTDCDDETCYHEYSVTDNVILVASYFGRLKFLNYCANQKIKFPQQALYLAIARMEKSLCDLCLSCGCKCDSHCMDIALKMGNKELVEYFFQKDIEITKDNIKFILNYEIEYFYNDAILNEINNLNSPQLKEQICIGLNFFVQRYIYNQETPLLSNYKAKHNIKDYMTKSERKKYKRTYYKNIEECINFALQNGYEIDSEIIDLCIKNNISINQKTIGNDKINLYYEAICAKRCSTLNDAKEVIKEIKKLIKSKNKFTIAMAAKILADKNSYREFKVGELLDIKEITKDKEMMEYFLDFYKIVNSISNNVSNNTIIKLLNIKHDYDKNILNTIRDTCPVEQPEIIEILIKEYNIEIEQKNINKYISPMLKLLIDNNKIEIKKI